MSVYDEAVHYFGVEGVEEIRAQARALGPLTPEQIRICARLLTLDPADILPAEHDAA